MEFYDCMLIPGGDTIRQLQVQCGAHIELHRGTHPNPNEKLFNIRGIDRHPNPIRSIIVIPIRNCLLLKVL